MGSKQSTFLKSAPPAPVSDASVEPAPEAPRSGLTGLVQDLRRRKVFRVAAVYAMVAWLVVEISSVVLPELLLPSWTLRLIIVLVVAGFPVALLLAWAFDITPAGVVRTPPAGEAPAGAGRGRAVDYVIIAVLVAVVAFLLWRPGGSGQEAASPRSIAVLPFVDLSENRDNEYFSDGIAEELLNLLVQAGGIRVAARTSSFAFKGRNDDIRTIGEQLNVDAILEGSVRRAGDRVRITAQLIDVRDGFHLWSDTYDRQLDDVFAIQDEIAGAIVEQLQLTLGTEAQARMARPPANSFEAYDLYLEGRSYWHQRTEESLLRARELFEQALDADPQFARAYSGLADTYLLLTEYVHEDGEDWLARAEAAVAQALRLDGGLAEAYASLGLLRLQRNELTTAELAFRQAISLDQSNSMAHMWLGLVLDRRQGPIAAEPEFLAAYGIDPLHPVININLSGVLASMGRFDEARDYLQRLLLVDPQAPRVQLALAGLSLEAGRYDETIQMLSGLEAGDMEAKRLRMLALAYAMLDDLASAEAIIAGAGEPLPPALRDARAIVLIRSARYEELAALARETVAGAGDDPYMRLSGQLWLAFAAFLTGDVEAAAPVVESAAAVDAGVWDQVPTERVRLLGIAAQLRRNDGEVSRAAELLERATALANEALARGWDGPEMLLALAGNQAVRGDRQRAMQTLRLAVDGGLRESWAIRLDPRFDPLRDEASYAAALDQIESELAAMRERVVAWVPASG